MAVRSRGKDPSKVDRSAAYAARWVAKHVVAAGAATRCEVQVAYAIGMAQPVSILVETFGTNTVDEAAIEKAVREVFDLRPAAIVRDLDLKRPIFQQDRCVRPLRPQPPRRSPGSTPAASTTSSPSSASDVASRPADPAPVAVSRVGASPSPGGASPVVITATVLPDVTGLDKTFDYLVPDDLVDRVRVGSLVRVALHGRRIGGWVVRVGVPDAQQLADVPVERLVPIAKWSGHGPSAEVIDLAEWAAHRWAAGRLRPLLVSASPPRMVHALASVPSPRPRTLDGASDGVRRLLADGGGVVRIAPTDDPVPIVLAAAERGRVLVIHPSQDEVGLLSARLRPSGLSIAVLPDGWPAAAAGAAQVCIGSTECDLGVRARTSRRSWSSTSTTRRSRRSAHPRGTRAIWRSSGDVAPASRWCWCRRAPR